MDKFGVLDDRFCGEEYHFRQSAIPGLGQMWEGCCPVCGLKWDIMAATTYPARIALCDELAQMLQCDRYGAYLIASRSFRFEHVNTRAVKQNAPESNPGASNVVPYRQPYAD
jgi:hypothetical protein